MTTGTEANILKAQQSFRRIGLALLLTLIAQIVFSAVLEIIFEKNHLTSSLANWLKSFAPMYLFAFPYGVWIMRTEPMDTHMPKRLDAKEFFRFLLICFPLMYIGDIVGTQLSLLLSGGTAKKPLESLFSDASPLVYLDVVVLAPLFEEWFFRKQLLGRAAHYGEKPAILLSALCFALFHGNLFQFFYTFGLGLVFAYLYVRTRRLLYPVALHMSVNIIGGVVNPFMVSLFDLNSLRQMITGAVDGTAVLAFMPEIGVFLFYLLTIVALCIAGLFSLLKQVKNLVFIPAPEELPRGKQLGTMFLNIPMALVILFWLAVCAAGFM